MARTFDESKDIKLFEEKADFGKWELILSVRSYNKGQPKLQISRVENTEKGSTFAKLGRLSHSELVAILPIIANAMVVMKKLEGDTNVDTNNADEA